MSSQNERIQLQLPQRTLEALSFSKADTASIDQWLKSLPAADTSKSASQLLKALSELSQLDLPVSHHLSLTELLRPTVYSIVRQICRQRLVSTITITEQQQKAFELCRDLLSKLLCCSKVAVQTSLSDDDKKSLLASALHRAMADSSYIYLLSCEHHWPPPERLWLEMHELYRIAEEHDLLDHGQDDPEVSKTRKLCIADQYKRSLLLSYCRANQLRAKEIRQINMALSLWAPHSRLLETPQNCYFVVNMNNDKGLRYIITEPGTSKSGLRGLDVRLLKAHLVKLSDSITSDKPGTLPKTIIDHLASAWNQPARRKHQRREETDNCHLCVGLSAAHYFLSNRQPFDELVASHDDASMSGKSSFSGDDAWSTAHDTRPTDGENLKPAGPHIIQYTNEGEENQLLYPHFPCAMSNTSASGYCLTVNRPYPEQLHTGEIMAIDEGDRGRWMLAAIRWLRVREQSIDIGVELLSAKTLPSAACTLKKTEDATNFHRYYHRCFILPAMPGINDTETLITPQVQFRNGAKIILLIGGEIKKAQLLECVSSTASYSQYQFRFLDETL